MPSENREDGELPDQEQRRRILERATAVQEAARVLAERLDAEELQRRAYEKAQRSLMALPLAGPRNAAYDGRAVGRWTRPLIDRAGVAGAALAIHRTTYAAAASAPVPSTL